MKSDDGNVAHFDAHMADTPPFYPMEVMNGFLTAKPNRHAPTTDADLAPREFRRFVGGSGIHDVQLNTGLWRKRAMGRRISFVNYLYAANARIPGQRRDNYSGYVKNGPGPIETQKFSPDQQVDPGGLRQIMGSNVFNPGTS